MPRAMKRLVVAITWLVAIPAMAMADPWPSIPIPAENAATLRRAPSRPALGDAEERARHLAAALGGEAAEDADDFFFPREAFLAVKDMSGASRYFAQLVRQYHRDIETYREGLPRGAAVRFVRLEPARSCRWMEIGREANRLPYWSCYGSRLVVEAGGREVTFRVHVMINWGDRWYVTHLGPIPHPR
jgi:hypothetical protein